jgi:hypothetical protein
MTASSAWTHADARGDSELKLREDIAMLARRTSDGTEERLEILPKFGVNFGDSIATFATSAAKTCIVSR